jgi:signal peptidase I
MRRALRLLGWLALAALLVGFVQFRPTSIGGDTTYVVTHGTSMLPRLHTGDLAIVQPARPYRVGDLVAYRSRMFPGKVVLHRIVAIDGDTYTFKGDNNSWLDREQPTEAQLLGGLRYRIPRAGVFRAVVGRPWVLLPILFAIFAGALALQGRSLRRRLADRRRRGRTNAAAAVADRAAPRWLDGAPRWAAVAAPAVAVALGSLPLWLVPTHRTVSESVPFQHSLTVRYGAETPPNDVYPDGHVDDGVAVFTQLVPAIDVQVEYGFDPMRHRVGQLRGRVDVVAEVSNAAGWRREVRLAPPARISGTHGSTGATLDVAALQEMQARVAEQAGTSLGAATVAVTPRVRVEGLIEGHPFTAEIAGRREFRLTGSALTPVTPTALPGGGDGPAPAAVPGTTQARGSVTSVGREPRTISVLVGALPVATARALSALAALAGLVGGVGAAAVRRRRTSWPEAAHIERRHRRWLAPVSRIPATGTGNVVPMRSMGALLRVARQYEAVIFEEATNGVHRYAVVFDGVVYTYDAAPPPAPVGPTAPGGTPVAAPLIAPVSAPLAAPVSAPLAAPVSAPLAAPVVAPAAAGLAPAGEAAPDAPRTRRASERLADELSALDAAVLALRSRTAPSAVADDVVS